MIKTMTANEAAASAASRWKAQYCKRGNAWRETCSGDTHEVYVKLIGLGPTPTPEEVNEVIGNDTWTAVICDECGQCVEAALFFGQRQDVLVCGHCVREGATKLNLELRNLPS